MVSDITIALMTDATQSFAEIKAVKDAHDEMVREHKIARNTMLRQIREGFTLISQLMSAMGQAFTLFSQQIDPFFSALIGMVLSTASMLISSATTLALTGIGGVAAAIILGIAVSFQILTLGKLVADKEKTDGIISSMMQSISAAAEKRAWGSGF